MAKLSKGFKELLIKSVIFVTLFLLIQFLTMGIVAKTSLPGDLKLFAMDDLAEAALFVLIIFIGLNREKIMKTKSYSVSLKSRILSGLVVVFGFLGYFTYKAFLINNLGLTANHIYLFTILEYLMLFLILYVLLGMIFGYKFLKDFFNEHKKSILWLLAGVVLIYLSVREFQGLWSYFSNFVASSVTYLLSFVGNSNLFYLDGLPILKFETLMVGIAKTCSGIDSVILFTGLYFGILAWDWKLLDKKKALLMYIPGVVGAFFLNILRIAMLMLIGVYISESFAIGTFHTNASSVLFIIYFAIFWKFSYPWMKLKTKKG